MSVFPQIWSVFVCKQMIQTVYQSTAAGVCVYLLHLSEGQASEELAQLENAGFVGVCELQDPGVCGGRSQTERLQHLSAESAAGRGTRRHADVGRVLLLRLVAHYTHTHAFM